MSAGQWGFVVVALLSVVWSWVDSGKLKTRAERLSVFVMNLAGIAAAAIVLIVLVTTFFALGDM